MDIGSSAHPSAGDAPPLAVLANSRVWQAARLPAAVTRERGEAVRDSSALPRETAFTTDCCCCCCCFLLLLPLRKNFDTRLRTRIPERSCGFGDPENTRKRGVDCPSHPQLGICARGAPFLRCGAMRMFRRSSVLLKRIFAYPRFILFLLQMIVT